MQKMRILSNSAKFSAYNFSATGAVASLKFLVIENMPPHFLAPIYYGQMAGLIRILLGTTEVCLGQDNITLDGDPPPRTERGTTDPRNFRPMSILAKWLAGSGYLPAYITTRDVHK